MPTGYTAPIEDNPSFSVEDFVRRSLRGMGACVHQRDESLEVPPRPPTVANISRYRDKVTDTKVAQEQRLAELKANGPAEYQRYVDDLAKRRAEYDREFKVKSRRYNTFIGAIESWDAPEELESFKTFMLEQLRLSAPGRSAAGSWLEPEPYEEWLAGQKEALQRSIEWAEKDYNNAVERYENSVSYISKVYEEWGLDPDWETS